MSDDTGRDGSETGRKGRGSWGTLGVDRTRRADLQHAAVFVSEYRRGRATLFAGSGTFIREGDRYFILTARHVWQDSLKNGDAVGVTLREVDDHRCFIETKAITPYGPALLTPRTNLGPDIVGLEIPPSAVGTIKAMRGFTISTAG